MDPHIVIIGGGVAGLSAGIYARMNGFKATIVEMHDIPGGQCTAWVRHGYHFDHCLHWLVGTREGTFNTIWKETGALEPDTRIVDHAVHTRVLAQDGTEFLVHTNVDRWEQYLLEIAPEDEKAVRRMIADMRATMSLEQFEDAPGTRSMMDYVKALFHSGGALFMLNKHMHKSCKEYFAELGFTSPRLKLYFDNLYGDMHFSAGAFLMMLTWMSKKNAGYPIGGSLPFAMRLMKRFKDLGGELLLKQRVTEIGVENGRAIGVVLEDGRRLQADHVIGAADAHSTLYGMLGGRFLTDRMREAFQTWQKFTPLVHVCFGIDKEITAEHATTTVLAQGGKIGRTTLRTGFNVLNYGFDPTLAPKGKTTIIIRFDSPWEIWKDLNDEAYHDEKRVILEEMTKRLIKLYPEVEGHIEVTDVATPRTDVRYTGVWQGAYEGFLPGPDNLNKNLEMRIPGLEGFTLIGQWVFPGGGLPPAAQSGRWAIQLLCKDLKREFRTELAPVWGTLPWSTSTSMAS